MGGAWEKRLGELSRRAARAAAFEWLRVGLGPGAEGRSRLPGAARQRRGRAEVPRYHEAPVSDGRACESLAPAAAVPRPRVSSGPAAPWAHLQAPRRPPLRRARRRGCGVGGWRGGRGGETSVSRVGAPARRRRGESGRRVPEADWGGRRGSGLTEAWTRTAVTYFSAGGADICTSGRGEERNASAAICLRAGFPEPPRPGRGISLFSDGSLVP